MERLSYMIKKFKKKKKEVKLDNNNTIAEEMNTRVNKFYVDGMVDITPRDGTVNIDSPDESILLDYTSPDDHHGIKIELSEEARNKSFNKIVAHSTTTGSQVTVEPKNVYENWDGTLNLETNMEVSSAWNTLTLNASGGTSGVSSVNNITGAVKVQAADSSITVTNSGQNINIKANGVSSTYRYESVSLMTYITNACFSQGISFKDFLVGKVPLFYPIETLFKNSNGVHANNPIPVGSDTIAVTYPMRITYPYTSSQLGLINTRLANAVSIKIDAYMEPQDGGVPRTNHYERKVNMEFLATTQPVGINPFGGDYFNGIGMCSKLDTDEDWTMAIANGRNIETGTEAPALDMFGYSDVTSANSYRFIKSLQVSEFKPGYLDATGILVARIIFEDIVLIKKYAYGV
jgi:hypothetical protein